MRSFAIIVAALSFGALSWAAPVPEANPLGMVEFGQRDITLPRALEVEARDVFVPEKRGGSPRTLEVILVSLKVELTPHCQKLSSCTKETATVEYLKDPITAIVELLLAAVAEILTLVGCTVEEILGKSGGGLLDCAGLARLLADVICLVLEAVGVVLKLIGFLLRGDLFELLCTILVALAKLIQCILDLVVGLIEGLLLAVIALVSYLLWVVITCNVTVLVKLLCI